MNGETAETLLDARGLKCPLPVLKAHRSLRELPPGSMLKILSTDEASLKEIPDFCKQTGHMLLKAESSGGEHAFWVKAGG